MSAPVDVRAVLDVRRHLGVKQSTKNANAAFLDWRDWCNYLPQADKARAAVAELVEECERLCAAADGMLKNADGMSKRSPVAQSMRISAKNILRLRPALANVGGQP
jgi:hypothetical protein